MLPCGSAWRTWTVPPTFVDSESDSANHDDCDDQSIRFLQLFHRLQVEATDDNINFVADFLCELLGRDDCRRLAIALLTRAEVHA